jgi:hypothetical protein
VSDDAAVMDGLVGVKRCHDGSCWRRKRPVSTSTATVLVLLRGAEALEVLFGAQSGVMTSPNDGRECLALE